ncbi:helix-turn-helix domain-containing protein [Pseudotenacibaculum haliotis]|uniref:Helix-turn-helix domain-containing protein n=1 Tax=Pseudotenacibaculum haliotis TaxID=1862138 RepID=A0ABW5LUN7_9FLAO
MNITWDTIYLAIQIVVSAQLFLGIVLNIFELKTRNLLLAYSCLLIVYTYNVFFSYDLNNWYLNKSLHIVASYIYFGPTLYLYLKSLQLEGATNSKELLKHYVLPFSFCLTYNIVQFPYYAFVIYAFLLFYSVKSYGVYKQVNSILSGTLKKRFHWFIGITFVYLVLDTPMLILEDLAILDVSPFVGIYPVVNEFFYSFIHYPILFAHFFVLSLYTITEIPRFKKYFLSKSLKESGVDLTTQKAVRKHLQQLFDEEKIYIDSELSLDKLSKLLELEKSLVSKLLRETYKKGYNEFINEYRIEEFKRLLHNSQYQNYDLVGLANESGFKSKATFFRVFKELEGMTPNQYKKKITS